MPVPKESTGGAGPEPCGSRACPGLGEISGSFMPDWSFSNRFMLVKQKTIKYLKNKPRQNVRIRFFCLFFETQAEGPTG